MKRTISINFEEGEADGKGLAQFKVSLSGDSERLGKTNLRELSPSEYWALKTFNLAKAMIQKDASGRKSSTPEATAISDEFAKVQ